MKILRMGAEDAAKIIRQKKLKSGDEYRLSLYAFPLEEAGRHLLLHTMTREALELTDEEWAAFSQFQNGTRNYDFLTQNGLAELAEKRYLVEDDYDETHAYALTLFLLRTAKPRKKGYHSYVIFPTSGCNARCVYCFEEGMKAQTMTEATADRLVDYICETKGDGRINLKWFGGEPLAGVNIIRRICGGLTARGVEFRSTIITNASLLTRELAHEAKESWHLTFAQVSLDGTREDYARRKRYVQPEKHNYDTVMRAIRYFADEGIRVSLRVNVDMENIQRIDGFLDEMGALFGEDKNVTLYLAPLFQELYTEKCEPLYDAIFARHERIRALGLGHNRWSGKKKKRSGIRMQYCMADNVEGSVVILPDGSFNHCEHVPANKCWGNIFDGVTDPALFEELRKPHEIDPDCAKCTFLPICTPFRRHGCPNWFEKCYIKVRWDTEEELRSALYYAETETDDDRDL